MARPGHEQWEEAEKDDPGLQWMGDSPTVDWTNIPSGCVYIDNDPSTSLGHRYYGNKMCNNLFSITRDCHWKLCLLSTEIRIIVILILELGSGWGFNTAELSPGSADDVSQICPTEPAEGDEPAVWRDLLVFGYALG